MKHSTRIATTLTLSAALIVPAGAAMAQPAAAAQVVAPTGVVLVQAKKANDEWIFGLKKPRVYVCRVAPALCR